MAKIGYFKVRGTGAFPVDMLRYDECYPTDSVSAGAIGMCTENVRAKDSKRTVSLATTKRCPWPTTRRWESFGWSVIEDAADLPG